MNLLPPVPCRSRHEKERVQRAYVLWRDETRASGPGSVYTPGWAPSRRDSQWTCRGAHHAPGYVKRRTYNFFFTSNVLCCTRVQSTVPVPTTVLVPLFNTALTKKAKKKFCSTSNTLRKSSHHANTFSLCIMRWNFVMRIMSRY